ncbi:hypothetical protein A2U01_0105380, partial [Trifolium medium]|nr:hypothetical protein [Trifolium medium]
MGSREVERSLKERENMFVMFALLMLEEESEVGALPV